MIVPATLTNSTERLSWPQIKDRYPDTWVGLTEIKFKNDDETNVETAVVYVNGDRTEVFDQQFYGPVNLVLYTSPEKHAWDNWMLWRA